MQLVYFVTLCTAVTQNHSLKMALLKGKLPLLKRLFITFDLLQNNEGNIVA